MGENEIEVQQNDVAESVAPETQTPDTPVETEPGFTIADAMAAIQGLTSRLDGFENWVNQAIGGLDKTAADEAQDSYEETGSASQEELAQVNAAYFERQQRYMNEGGYV